MGLKWCLTVAVLLAIVACSDSGQIARDTRALADRCQARGGTVAQCECFASEVAKQVNGRMLAGMVEHSRARQGEAGAALLSEESLLIARAAQANAQNECVGASNVTRANMDEILGDYLMRECEKTGAGHALCECQWEDFRRRVSPETRLVMAHAAAGDDPNEYPMNALQAAEIAIANHQSLQKCMF